MSKRKKSSKQKIPQKKNKFSVDYYNKKIISVLENAESGTVSSKQLESYSQAGKGNMKNFRTALEMLQKNGTVSGSKKGYSLSEKNDLFKAEIVRLNKTFGFARRTDNNEEVFVPGKFLLGSLVGDTVLMRYIKSRSGNPEGEVVDILETGKSLLAGNIIEENKNFYLICNNLPDTPLKIIGKKSVKFKKGDKVLAEILFRGKHHSDHKAAVVYSYGSADKASNCASALIDSEDVPITFPDDVINEAQEIFETGIKEKDLEERLDLRKSEIIFTIDSEHSKDLDDAVSIRKTSSGYKLGVHIADVSHYVRAGHPLDKEAMNRGTSIYYADKVIPMLPKELSNGICSLNPGEDRLTFSALMTLDNSGQLTGFEFKKSVIRSKVKGIYKEVNAILDGTANDEIKNKYSELTDTIKLLNELCDLRLAVRKKRGAPEIETAESEFTISDNDTCIDVTARERGKSEQIIEEMMLLANESAAKFSKKYQLPFVYRVHEKPSEEKIQQLSEKLLKLGLQPLKIKGSVKPADLASLLEKTKDKEIYPVLNNIVLRSMAKAKYSDTPLGHFGLALDDYAHFTSPIRRYPDLSIHRIMSAFLIKQKNGETDVGKKLVKFASRSAESSTAAELRATALERKCDDYYKAEYMTAHIGEEYTGQITSVEEYGFYTAIPNSVEGLVGINSLPIGIYDIDEGISITETVSGLKYKTGDRVKVRCVKSDVRTGKIDFELCQ